MSLLIDLLRQGTIPWIGWDDARRLQDERPRLVLTGSSLDHWSSRLAAELNADPEVSGALAELFVCVAVDAAAEPGPAALVQHALALTAESTGQPAIAVCTPERAPFGALPWRPLPDLAQRLLGAAEAWHLRREDCLADAASIERAWRALRAPATGRPLNPGLLLDAAESAAMEVADSLAGGFGPAPRTAEPALWGFLVARAARSEAPLALAKQVERSLAALCAGASHDHVGGGFFRGTSDAGWREPLCEKRLADQAQLALLLLDAADGLGNPLWRDVAQRTLQFAIGALRRPDGAYAHGLHADSPAAPGRWEEGACYRWTVEEAEAVVGVDGAELVARRFGLPGIPGVGEPIVAPRLAELVHRLAVARAERPPPRRDGSVYAAEQGMIALALERAGLIDALPPLSGDDPWTGRALAARWRHTGTAEPRALEIAALDRDEDLDPAGSVSAAAVLAHLRLDLVEITGDSAWRDCVRGQIDRSRDRLRSAPLACAGMMGVVERVGV